LKPRARTATKARAARTAGIQGPVMEISPLDIPDVKILRPKKHGDARGFFSETWSRAAMAEAGLDIDFVQDNQSLSATRGTVRGLHFQTPPHAQAKLLRVIRGAVFDVAVDLRRGSPTYGRHASAVISAEEWNQILVPVGFAHGFMTLEPDTEVIYKVSGIYSPANDAGILWNDPDLGIAWLLDVEATLSDKDRVQPRLRDFETPFVYEG
jgi:dTDP-4-dehydrorhamnose 3,5-epimerase